jgi:uncharacterized membrane protein
MFRSARLKTVLLLLLSLTPAMVANVAVACPTCKDAVAANDPEHEHMVKGYFYSILFMMGMPYLLLTSFGIYMYREVKKARAKKAAEAAAAVQQQEPAAEGVSGQLQNGGEVLAPRELIQV